MSRAGLGALGLWLHLRSRPGTRLDQYALPPGDGPLIVLCPGTGTGPAVRRVVQAMRLLNPDLRLISLGQDDVPDFSDDSVAAPQFIARAQPSAVLLFGDALPPALIDAASRAGIPVVLIEAQISAETSGWSLAGGMQRRLMSSLTLVMVADKTARDMASRLGVPDSRLRLTGPVAEIHDPLSCVEAERMALATMLRGRLIWLATSVPLAEEQAVIEAHRAALRQSHRALLIFMPNRPDRTASLAAALESAGLAVARRNDEEDPTSEVQVLVAEDMQEIGLWYRLAQVSFMGGTLSGRDSEARHPFEPAALGSAIIRGPAIGAFETEWRQLDGAGATRIVRDAAGLADAVADLIQPELAARLAGHAWTVSTGGAVVARQIAQPVLELIRERVPT
ncbi:MAG: glycosyltransferase N-terminal domain-containing protein [Paracoccus sp. (in: a-proteobacteria)]|uniref:3-deoxy-D-manno-octulosonic acid transferase n=1 Tax=Paracoccus sp. TaxID=267 RepID=UPI0026E00D1D|nr:glycosyltransferase N-terminal domain-containing protein [Paracoccus sp. (in: a-proteobacteria)]MDO5632453.1 glycosyltransferase N-terminal domain-containing protein [Paracoccus sp. (in: a-proteobacteria)]